MALIFHNTTQVYRTSEIVFTKKCILGLYDYAYFPHIIVNRVDTVFLVLIVIKAKYCCKGSSIPAFYIFVFKSWAGNRYSEVSTSVFSQLRNMSRHSLKLGHDRFIYIFLI